MLENQPIFEPMVSTLEHFTKDNSDLSNAKLAFTVLSKMAMVWGGPDIVASHGSVTGAMPQPVIPGFDRFMMERFSPLVWELPGNAEFNPKDAQAAQVLGEAGHLHVSIYMKTGQAYASYLEATELRNVGLDADRTRDYISALSSPDSKIFRRYFKVLARHDVQAFPTNRCRTWYKIHGDRGAASISRCFAFVLHSRRAICLSQWL